VTNTQANGDVSFGPNLNVFKTSKTVSIQMNKDYLMNRYEVKEKFDHKNLYREKRYEGNTCACLTKSLHSFSELKPNKFS